MGSFCIHLTEPSCATSVSNGVSTLQKSMCRTLAVVILLATLLFNPSAALADTGSYIITQLPYAHAQHPSINNAGEIVWAVDQSTGIVSSVRGTLSVSGQSPHLSNSGEVVYADIFTNGTDLVSTTRGRLTQGGLIDLGWSDFDVNSNGEVVYVALDNNNFHQVYSTVRGQVTFDSADHYNPCINDLGEILWGPGLVSSTRGPIPGNYSPVYGFNNHGEFCFQTNLQSGGLLTAPHLASSVHGVVTNDLYTYQFYGDINDAGTLVWNASGNPDFAVSYIFEAIWVPGPTLTLASTHPGFALQWPTNSVGYHVQYATNLTTAPWQRLSGSPITNSPNYFQSITQAIGSPAFFRLANGSP